MRNRYFQYPLDWQAPSWHSFSSIRGPQKNSSGWSLQASSILWDLRAKPIRSSMFLIHPWLTSYSWDSPSRCRHRQNRTCSIINQLAISFFWSFFILLSWMLQWPKKWIFLTISRKIFRRILEGRPNRRRRISEWRANRMRSEMMLAVLANSKIAESSSTSLWYRMTVWTIWFKAKIPCWNPRFHQ